MSHQCKIAGRDVSLAWTNSSLRSLRFRAGKIREDPRELFGALADNARAEYAAGALLWMLAPDDLHAKHAKPESLWLTVGDDEIEGVIKAIVGTLADSNPDAEKKMTSQT